MITTIRSFALCGTLPEQIGFPYGPAVQLLILTGARQMEVGKLRWDEIGTDSIELPGDRTKNGEPHSIPLSSAARGIVAKLPRVANSPYLFHGRGNTPVNGWAVAKKRLDELANIPAWTIHDLRRTMATGLQKLGTPLQVTEAILNHVSGSRAGIVGVYQRHDYAEEKRAAFRKLGKAGETDQGHLNGSANTLIILAMRVFLKASRREPHRGAALALRCLHGENTLAVE